MYFVLWVKYEVNMKYKYLFWILFCDCWDLKVLKFNLFDILYIMWMNGNNYICFSKYNFVIVW